ncbi:acyltransferase family protein [Paenibacillus silviterrae]|uniref:acyltransferase family protein n=1 Tax=Paenibacillus silviterrae TaxID=3242194 RepID=UPI00254338C2|nr:acyltransferase family protein [Paenibacillus chinjuensis]
MDSSVSRGSARIPWVDQAKGWGIILVIIAHTQLDQGWVGKYINSFHMPLFFLLSGYLFSLDKYTGFGAFVRKKTQTLLIPYFGLAALSYLYFLFRFQFGDPDYYKDLDITRQLLGVFYSAGTREWMDFNLPLWFLTCLFVVELLFYSLRRFVKKTPHLAITLLLLSFIGYADGLWNPVKLPWGMDVAVTAVVFYGLGYLLKNGITALVGMPVYARLIIAAVMIGVNVTFIQMRVNLNMKVHGDYLNFYVCAIAGMTACLLLSSIFRSSAVAFLGRNALVLLAVHMPLLNIASKINTRLGLLAPFGIYANELAEALITILLLVPVIYFMNTFTPFLLGKGWSRASKNNLEKRVIVS